MVICDNKKEMEIQFENNEEELKTVMCYCEGHCPLGQDYGTCETKPGGKCFTSVELDIDEEGQEYPLLSYGCLPPNEMALFQCRATLLATRESKTIKCCDEYDFCNKHLLPVIKNPDIQNLDPLNSATIKVLLSSLAVSFIVFAMILIFVYLKYKKEERDDNNHQNNNKNQSDEVENGTTINISNVNNVLNCPNGLNGETSTVKFGLDSTKSHSDFGLTGLVQRTISKQIQMELMIASGKYAEVWRAKWRGEKVAVKMYVHMEEQSWLRESEIYQTVLMRHENILGYIAADIKGNGNQTQMFLITEYHERGSLYDFLNNHSVPPEDLFKMAKGVASGLNHLHTEVFGTTGKPAIAHNNINSKNILVKRNRECCIGDFAKAVKFFSCENRLDLPPTNFQNSQIRYLAPEILEHSFNQNNFDSYKMADVYSFALVLWELANRCEIGCLLSKTKYQRPFEEEMSSDDVGCAWEKIADVVAQRKIRPCIKKEWENNNILKSISKVMVECWSGNPSVRLTSLRIKKTLFKLDS